MRTIKFRCWDKERRTMKQITSIHFFENKLSFITVEDTKETIYGYNLDPNQFEIMQFTGLLDKNGKEILEGDILQHFNHDHIWGSKKKFIMIFDVERGKYRFKDYLLSPEDIAMNNFEIIGNIHENPDLLGEK